eukprot:m.300836 g.300836  ORF g.300836 m.300836 type:complete len:217 (-) comp19560_c0_seq2:352-1002(-)
MVEATRYPNAVDLGLLGRSYCLDLKWDPEWMCRKGIENLYDFEEDVTVATKERMLTHIYTIRTQPLPENDCVSYSFEFLSIDPDDVDVGVCGDKSSSGWMRSDPTCFSVGANGSIGSSSGGPGNSIEKVGSFRVGTVVTVVVDTGLRQAEIHVDHDNQGSQLVASCHGLGEGPLYGAVAFRKRTRVRLMQLSTPPVFHGIMASCLGIGEWSLLGML